MNASFAPFAASLVGWLADFYLLATLLLGLTFLGLRWVRQPVHRLSVAWIVMIELGVLAVLCAMPGWPRISLMPAAPRVANLPPPEIELQPSPEPAVGWVERSADPPVRLSSPPSPMVGQRLARPTLPDAQPRWTFAMPSYSVLVGGGFLVGLGLVGCWLGWGAAATILLCRRATAAPPGLMAQLSEIVRQARLPRLLLSGRIGNAAALGVVRPAILLPSNLAQESPPHSVRAVLAHEWAHIRNHDLWLLALGRCLLALLFAHPLFWWLRRRVRNDQEMVADAVAARENRPEYAEDLVRWVRLTSGLSPVSVSAAVGIWEGPSQLTRRIATLLDDSFRVETAASRRWKYQAVGLLVLLGAACSLVTLQPARLAGEPAPLATAATSEPQKMGDQSAGQPAEAATRTNHGQAVPATTPPEMALDVQISGNKSLSLDKILPMIRTRKGRPFDRVVVEEDIGRLTAFYRTLGFFRAHVGRELSFNEKENMASITFVIDEGPRYKIRNVSVQGNKRYTSEQLMADLKLKKGEYFNQPKMVADLRTLKDKYRSADHASADITADTRFLEAPDQLDIVYNVKEGATSSPPEESAPGSDLKWKVVGSSGGKIDGGYAPDVPELEKPVDIVVLPMPPYWRAIHPAVAAELHLTDQQKTSLREIGTSFGLELERIKYETKDLSPEEKNAARVRWAARQRKAVQSQLEKALAPEQLQTLNRITFAMAFYDGLQSPALGTRLDLTRVQQRGIALFGAELRCRVAESQLEAAHKAMFVLTPQQRAQLREKDLGPLLADYSTVDVEVEGQTELLHVTSLEPYRDFSDEEAQNKLGLSAAQRQEVREILGDSPNLTDKLVCEAMKLSPEERKKPNQLAHANCQEAGLTYPNFFTPEERAKRRSEYEDKLIETRKERWAELEAQPMVKTTVALRKQFEAILTPEQLASYKDMAIFSDPKAVSEYIVLKQIGGSDEQYVALQRVDDEYMTSMARVMWEVGEKMLAALTPDQQELARDDAFSMSPYWSDASPAKVVPVASTGESEPAKKADRSDGVGMGTNRGNRGERAEESAPGGGESRASKDAVAAALNWLARHQSPDGSWSLNNYDKQCKDDTCTGHGAASDEIVGTALGLLPFLAAGQTHESKGPYQKNINKGVHYLLDKQQPDGSFNGGTTTGEQSGAALTLCECYGMTGDKAVGKAAQAALDYIEKAQDPNGGWGPAPKVPGDRFMPAWQIMALRSGQLAGLKVAPAVLDKAKQFLKSVSFSQQGNADGGLFRFLNDTTAPSPMATAMGPTATAIGLLCYQCLGVPRTNPAMIEGTAYLMENPPKADGQLVDYWYFATQMLHNQPGPDWDTWNRKMRRILIESQAKEGCATGSWDPKFDAKDMREGRAVLANFGGRVAQTSLSALTLEVYYRYLPLYKLDDVLVLDIDKAGNLHANGRIKPNAEQYIAAEAKRHAGAVVAQNAAGKELPTKVVIQADRATPFEAVDRVIKICERNGFRQLALQVSDESGPTPIDNGKNPTGDGKPAE